MTFTITFRYNNKTFDRIYKSFETWEHADWWAENEMNERGATDYWVI